MRIALLTESSVAGNCRESTGGTQVCQSGSMAIAVSLTMRVGPQTGTPRATWFAYDQWTLVRHAATLLRQNCLAAIRRRRTKASEMPNQAKRVTGTSSEYRVM